MPVTVAAVAPYVAVAAGAYSIYNGATASSKSSTPALAAPAVAPPTALPTPEATGNAAAKLSLVDQLQRRGRASTILTDTTDKLGA